MLPTGSTFVAMRKLCASNCGSRIKSMSGFFSARRLPPVEDNQTAVTPIIIEGRNIGQPLAKRTLSPFAQPMPIDATGLPGFPAQSIGGMAPHVAPSTNVRSEEHTSELQSLMRISYAVFCLKKKNNTQK